MKHKIIFYSDAAHGWAAIPIKDLQQLGIEQQISRYSYQKGQTVYLEEDLDLTIYLDARTAAGIPKPQFEERYRDRSPIRSYAAYTPPYIAIKRSGYYPEEESPPPAEEEKGSPISQRWQEAQEKKKPIKTSHFLKVYCRSNKTERLIRYRGGKITEAAKTEAIKLAYILNQQRGSITGYSVKEAVTIQE